MFLSTCVDLLCSGGGDLSVLARGRGLVGGGVEVECFADDRKAFTLTVSMPSCHCNREYVITVTSALFDIIFRRVLGNAETHLSCNSGKVVLRQSLRESTPKKNKQRKS